jgi:hypothetical protein
MALTIKNESNGGGYESLPVGQYKAACYRIVDVGTHNETYEGETSKRHSVFIYWETPDNKMSDGKPFSIMKQYTLSLNEKSALFRDLCSWRKKKFTSMRKKEVKIFLLLILWQKKVLSPRKISRFDGLGCWVRI